MKHRFLLDVMIIYHAVKRVDEKESPDPTADELIRLIGENCHTVVADKVLLDKYSPHLTGLLGKPPLQVRTTDFLLQILHNAAKFVVESEAAPELPSGVRVPPEDIYVVTAALISRPFVITAERGLLQAINNQRDLLGLTALTPGEALELARDS